MDGTTTSAAPSGAERWLPRQPDVIVLAAATFLLALGDSLWFKFAPRYLEALGAGAVIVGAFASLQDLLDAAWQVPGGWMADHLGRKRALLLLTALSLGGIALFLAPAWPIVLLGLVLYMAQQAYAQPATFAALGDALPSRERARGFVLQSSVKRLPILVGAPLGGWLITVELGVLDGVRAALLMAALATLLALAFQARGYRAQGKPARPPRLGLRELPPGLRRLLLSDILVRMGESATKTFIVLYVVHELGFTDLDFGLMVAFQTLVTLAVYLPAGRAADLGRRKPWVALTFVFFTLTPLAVLGARSWPLLLVAFAVMGLREVGEPARKASIVDMAPEHARGRAVGAYYAVRGFAIMPIGLLAGFLWTWNPAAPFLAGALLSLAGLVAYVVAVPEE